MRHSGRLVTILAVLASLLIAGGTLVSAHGGGVADEVIHSCVNNASGRIQIVGAEDECSANDSALDWNAIGP